MHQWELTLSIGFISTTVVLAVWGVGSGWEMHSECTLCWCADDIPEAYNLIKDLEPTTPQEYILKGVVNAALGQEQGSVSTDERSGGRDRGNGGLLPGQPCCRSTYEGGGQYIRRGWSVHLKGVVSRSVSTSEEGGCTSGWLFSTSEGGGQYLCLHPKGVVSTSERGGQYIYQYIRRGWSVHVSTSEGGGQYICIQKGWSVHLKEVVSTSERDGQYICQYIRRGWSVHVSTSERSGQLICIQNGWSVCLKGVVSTSEGGCQYICQYIRRGWSVHVSTSEGCGQFICLHPKGVVSTSERGGQYV